MKEVVVASKNKDKIREIKKLLKGFGLKVKSSYDFKDIPTIKEDGKTMEENAVKKAVRISRHLDTLVLSDDSGLEVEILGGRPGIYSARFSGKGATYKSNNKKLLFLLKNVSPRRRKARFKCVVAIADKGRLVRTVTGICNGMISDRSRGKKGFGYDPVFIPSGYKKTFAEIGIREKNRLSHRGKAFRRAAGIIKKYIKGEYRQKEFSV